jgi:hypothetical protein
LNLIYQGYFQATISYINNLHNTQKFYIFDQGQEEIKLRLDNVAYRFELRDLEKTVKLLIFRIKRLEENK